MKKRISLSLAVISVAAFGVQLAQQLVGFEPDTGLPTHGNLFLLPMAVLAAVWFFLTRPLPHQDVPQFPRDFSMEKTGLMAPVAGLLMVAVSGLGWLMGVVAPPTMDAIAADGTLVSVAMVPNVPPTFMLVLGVLSLVLAISLLPSVVSCLRRDPPRPCPTTLLYVAPVALVVRVVLVYRIDSVDPVVSRYAVELLALVCLTLSFYRLSGFGCGVGDTRRFVLYGGWAVMLSIATLADGHGFPDAFFYLGCALTLLGLLMARLSQPVPETAEAVETAETTEAAEAAETTETAEAPEPTDTPENENPNE